MAILTEFLEASSSSFPTSDYRYDVFLSFRGFDTRQNFTDHLHKALLDANIDTFLDDEEIQTGEFLKPELESAIKASRASIIVLSKNYASSTWCLDELVLILERHRTSKHVVIPIFYHVEPTDVRKQQSSFGDGLAKHTRRMEEETNVDKRNQWAEKLELWKKALTEVADLKGEAAKGLRETELIKEIVKKISSTLRLHLQRELPHLIGMKDSIKSITSWLEDGDVNSAQIFTIWGMPGIGKTSLAKYVHQLHYLKFERSSFLEDIGRKCIEQSSRLIDFQKQLLEDISNKTSIKIRDADACTCQIEKSLIRKKVFLVLDGIDSSKQLDALLGKKGFHSGSKIIITTKDQSLIEQCALFNMEVQPKHTKHLLKALDWTDSRRLLSWHAFRRDNLKEGYEEISRNVLKYCGGHPLALEVLGSSLRNKDVVAWKDMLEDLEKEANPDIKKVLQISFDSLPSEKDKNLFKHIACFFVGKDAEYTENILKACDIGKSSGIKNLTDRCLLSIGSKNELMMHQLLQDMGRDIVCQESLVNPWKRSLLWHHEEIFNMLKVKKGTKKIEGLVLDMKKFENETSCGSSSVSKKKFGNDLYENLRSFPLLHRVSVLFSVIWWLFGWFAELFYPFHHQNGVFEVDAFSKMSNLRLLHLNYVQLSGSYMSFPKGLRWLCMHGFALSCIPVDLQMEHMVALDMSYSNLQQPWKNPKLLGSLKFLNLSYCDKLVRVSHFSGLCVLERLILAGCVSLIEVCESIGNCDRLVLLDLKECSKLKRLPRSIGKLKNLITLLIDGCTNLVEFPVEMKDMESLKVLSANNISVKPLASSSAIMEHVPRGLKLFAISLPRSLVKLSLRNNNLFNESFPMDFRSLSVLEELSLDENPIVFLPNCVRSLSRLRHLSLNGCLDLESVLHAPCTIKKFFVYGCSSLGKITFHPEMSTPPVVYSDGTESLNEIGGVFKMEAIVEIDEEILSSLGWHNLKHVKNYKLQMWRYGASRAQRLPVQMVYEHGIFSTFFKGKEVPSWFTHRSNGSLVSFTLHSSLGIHGLNACFVYTSSENLTFCPLTITMRNCTKNSMWLYFPRTHAVPESNEEGIIWLSHWMFENNEFEDGDEVSCELCDGGIYDVHVRGCGISVMYDGGNKEDDPLAYYKSWKQRIGGDLLDTSLVAQTTIISLLPR